MERADKAIGLRLVVCVVLLSACLFSPIGNLFAAAPDQPVHDPWQELQTGPRPHNAPLGLRVPGIRHRHYLLIGAGPIYEGAKSNVPADGATVAAGGTLYMRFCAHCHGPTGFGVDNPDQTLLPSPALLALLMNRRISIDEYLLWSIAEGGTQFETAMPAFKGVLTREEIWRIIVFMRAGFAAETPPSAKP